ncbi:MAG: PP2C family protein-serine/threonine phosphatase [Fervidobacterium sp.]|uniref:PP2C family protein-serine/threonine phosphatase n=1 Tax=Fervidobacterium sp. TaxID=1871331 RepID=UPI00404AA9EB
MNGDKIIIITNEEHEVEELFQILEFVGYNVKIINSVSDFIDENDVQAVIIFNRLSKITQEYVRWFRVRNEYKDIPIIVLVNDKDYVTLLDFYQIGISDYIELPIVDVEAISKIALHIELKKNRERIENLYKELKESLELSTQLQKLMLPNTFELKNKVWFTSRYIPSQVVGGDMFDYFSVNDAVYAYVADISGHGVQSALLCSAVKSLFRAAAQKNETIYEVVNEMAVNLKNVLGRNYVTGLFMKITQDKVEYLNCGHPALITYDGDKFTMLEMKSIFPIGLFDYDYSQEDSGVIEIDEKQTYMAYSDGLYSIFERNYPHLSAMELLMKFLNQEISGIVPEAVPYYVASVMLKRYGEFPDDYSVLCFGKNERINYIDHTTKDEASVFKENFIYSVVSDLIKNAYSDEYALMVSEHEKYYSIISRNIETGWILRKIPMSITLTFNDVDVIKLFK